MSVKSLPRLENKVAIVTGAGGFVFIVRYMRSGTSALCPRLLTACPFFSGIGRESAILFAREGAKVVCADINLQGAQVTVDMITELFGEGNAFAFKVNVAKEEEVKDLVDAAVEKYGKLNVMFNNAGIMHSADDNALNTEQSIWYALQGVSVRILCRASISLTATSFL
jgi:NAD(P)-dependent dehydrogenase (short-subunit alcohol dehydrogenase family)